jgi:hypothetical protein
MILEKKKAFKNDAEGKLFTKFCLRRVTEGAAAETRHVTHPGNTKSGRTYRRS